VTVAHRARLLALAALVLLGARPALGAPEVVVTLAPIHSLVAGVMAGAGVPELLIASGASPHDRVLRLSMARLLDGADIVFQVGGGLEGFLEKPLRALGDEVRVVTLAEADGVTRAPLRKAGIWADTGTAVEDGRGGAYNPHIWLDPGNAEAIVRAVALELGRLDPGNAARYAEGAQALLARLGALDAELARILAPVADVPFVVFHDAFPGFAARYGLAAVGALAVSPDRPPGARRLTEIRAHIGAAGIRCVFAEPQFRPALAEVVVEGTGARIAFIDPLGIGVPPGPAAYFTLMRTLAKDLRACLEP
jgi:zinc transport system substrate-binding protein